MRKTHFGLDYCGKPFDKPLRCMVAGCSQPVVAEVHITNRGRAHSLFPSANGRLAICQDHLQQDPRAQKVMWQMFLFPV